ncbi:unnamed protein product [Gemmata massiliana]|uniref:Uncharacterized protein n=1 Tax=Gemmata massiliana TaxID=1210884 RepID=A0A6P2D7G5_9BACT|nr:hypothetical protein [Gemmata massiliana]VTR96315.1 unnamed protein product [Gemmata massiliana]
MSGPQHPVTDAFDYEGCVTAGRATGKPIPLPSDEDLRRAEEAWNNPAFYELWKDEPFVGADWVPKPTVDPNRPLVVTREEIAKLPRWARVAFAARCARRVLPIVKKFWKTAPKHHLLALDKAVSVAEQTAARAADADYAAAYAAARAAAAAAAAYADAAYQSLLQVVTAGTINYLTAPARDFDRLHWLAVKEQWTDDTLVPPTVFGPMWDGSPPEWWSDDILADLPDETNDPRERETRDDDTSAR